METIREARLKREAADRYPFIPVRMWTQAERMADLVREHLERVGRRVRARRRALADRDFGFRSGFRHPPGAHTRMTDPETAATTRGSSGSPHGLPMTTPPALLFSSTSSSTQPAVCKSLRLSDDVGLGE